MKNGDESFISRKNKENICFICKSDKIPINMKKINDKKLKKIITDINKKEGDSSILIKKCNCRNNKQKAHKICLLLNIIFNFDLKCDECKADYNIYISKHINNYKRCCNICSFISLLIFHLCLYAGAAFLILYILIINRNTDKLEDNKLYHIYYFFAAAIIVINTILMTLTFSTFLDKNYQDICEYNIQIKDISEPKMNNKSDLNYELLYKYYRFFYNTQIRYLIGKKQKNVFMSKGYGNFNKDLQDIIYKNNKESLEENTFNNGGEDILNLNKKSIENEKIKKNNINTNISNKNNIPKPSNGIMTNMSFKKSLSPKKEEEKNNDIFSNEDKKIKLSEKKTEKKSENTNPINLEISNENNNNNNQEKEPNLEIININKSDLIEKEEEEKKQENKIKNDIELNNNNNNENNNENIIIEEKINEKKSINASNYSERIPIKKEKNIAKTYFYKKINNNNILGKSKTLIDPEKKKRKRERKENTEIKEKQEKQEKIEKQEKKEKNEKIEKKLKLKIYEEEKKYIDSTFLVKEEKTKIEENKKVIEEDPFDMFISMPFHNNGK